MNPETLIALLLTVSLLGVTALAVLFYLLKRRTDGRVDALNSFLDSLDERLSHKFTLLDRKADEIRKSVSGLEPKLEQERTDRETAANDLFKRTDALLEALEINQKKADSVAESLELHKQDATAAFENLRIRGEETASQVRQEVVTIGEQTNQAIEKVSARQWDLGAAVEQYSSQVSAVRRRNDLQLAIVEMGAKNAEKASEILSQLIREEPSNHEALILAIRAEAARGATGQARSLIERGLDLFPGDASLLAESAHLYRREGNRADRARVLAEGLVRHPDHPRLRFERALLHIETNRYEMALEDLQAAVSHGEETAAIRYNLGIVQIALGNIPAAVAELRRSLLLDPTSADCNHALGLALMHHERFQEAVDFLERARENLPQITAIRLDLALALRRSGKPDAALRECAVARHLNPNIPRIGLEEALCYHDMAEFTAALAKLDAVLAAYPTYARARRFKAEILEEIERFEDAVEEWSHMAGNNPADPYLQASLGEALKKAGKPAAALGCLEMAARMAPDSPKIQLTFAREAMTQRRFDLAQEVVEQASPRASTPQSRLQFIEFRFLLALKLGRWSALVPLLSDLKGILEGNPDIIPLDKDLEFDGEMLLSLGLGKDAAKIYSGLVELFEGTTDYDLFDELVTDVMRSLLPPKPKPIPLPEPAIREEQPSLAALNESALAGPPEKPESAPLETGQETDLRETPSPESTSQAAGEPAEPESQDSATVSLGQIPGDVPAPEETAEAVIPKGKKKQSKKKKRGVSP